MSALDPGRPRVHRRRAERGLALVCALMLMLAAMTIGVAIARGAAVLRAAAYNERDRDMAQAAADAALRDAERDVAGPAGASPQRRAHFGPGGAAAFVDGCGRGADDLGLCRATSPPAWQALDLADADNPAVVPYGRFTGAVLAVGRGVAPARLPAYVVERIVPAGTAAAHGSFYRVTAIGFGMRASTRVVLQAIVRLPAPAPPPAPASASTGGSGSGTGTGEGGGDGPGHGHEGGHGSGNGHGNEDGRRDDGNDGDGHAGAAAGGHGGGSGAGSGGRTGNGNDDGSGGDAPGNDGPGGAAPPPDRPPGRTLPAGRLGWREIANWPELHARAQP